MGLPADESDDEMSQSEEEDEVIVDIPKGEDGGEGD